MCLAILALSSCETAPSQPVVEPVPQSSGEDMVLWQAMPRPVAYKSLPDWDGSDLAPGLSALKRSCDVFESQVHCCPDAPHGLEQRRIGNQLAQHWM
jgi:hypothetical protein